MFTSVSENQYRVYRTLRIITLFVVVGILFIISSAQSAADSELEELRKELRVKQYIPVKSERLNPAEFREFYSYDYKKIKDLNLRLFYSMGKVSGYAVFINSDNDFSIVEGSQLKIILKHRSFMSGSKTIFLSVEKNKFRKLTLKRGDTIIAFEIPRLRFREVIPGKTYIKVDAEFFGLSDKSIIYMD
ncbi:MAG: hypothetical protein ABUK01_11645 [Leptospirales bacterium]